MIAYTLTYEDGNTNVVVAEQGVDLADIFKWARENDRGVIAKVSYKYVAHFFKAEG